MKALITGGAGFIGTNVAARLLDAGHSVRIFDNVSRAGVEQNLDWLRQTYGQRVEVSVGDVRNRAAVAAAVAGVSQVYHFAAQVAVTTSLDDPLTDFDINAAGTLRLLEVLRAISNPPSVVFTSTNKVYGSLDDVELVAEPTRYVPVDVVTRQRGIGEQRRLDFHSPYGCSKGAADQYVLDYARTFDLRAVVLRMSCIYGPHQCGNEDQGWVAHFVRRGIEGRPIRIYGDGRQVRDILYVDDLVDALLLAHEAPIAGEAFNIGGGPGRTISLLELIEAIDALQPKPVAVEFDEWRAADQRYYVSDTRKFGRLTGWSPRIGVKDGIRRLHEWLIGVTETVEPLAS